MDRETWWKYGIIYQIYPRSFQDSNHDGVGDLRGIIERLDYLVWLGIDAVWVSPIYPSPMADFGYDVADYCDIDLIFGTLADFDHLVAEVHRREMRLILDFVPNHTSDRHPWFLESRSSRDNPKRDWYVWRDGRAGGHAPTNWMSNFGGSAWTYDELTGQSYLHSFLKEQPDLNWRNPEVRAAMFAVLRFWLDRGVDGFRVDVISNLIKDAEFRDNPPNPAYTPGQPDIARFLQVYSADRPENQDVIAEMRRVVDAYPGRLLIGEIYLPLQRLMAYYGKDLSGVQLPFNFLLLKAPWDPRRIAALIDEYEGAIPPGGWPNWVLGNHDQPRVASRIGAAQARVAALLLLTLRGTPTLYYGDEIGMHDVHIPPAVVQDPAEKNEPGIGMGRDPERTPMQWDGTAYAGFSTHDPWLPVADDFAAHNVGTQRGAAESMLTFCRRLIALRRRTKVLTEGGYVRVDCGPEVLSYERMAGKQRLLVVLNLRPEARDVRLPAWVAGGRVAISTDPARAAEIGTTFELRSDEGVVILPRGEASDR